MVSAKAEEVTVVLMVVGMTEEEAAAVVKNRAPASAEEVMTETGGVENEAAMTAGVDETSLVTEAAAALEVTEKLVGAGLLA